MRILVAGLDYAPHRTGIGPYTTRLAEAMAERGHDVTVVTTFPYYPAWSTFPEYRGRRYSTEQVRGVRVRRSPVRLPSGRRRFYQRIVFDSSLAVSGLPRLLTRERPDVIVCVSPPLQLAATVEVVAAARRIPVVVHVQDLVPDAAVAVGMMREGRGVGMAGRVERFVYRHATVISVISNGFRDNLLAKGVSADRIRMHPNWVATEPFLATSDGSHLREALGVGPRGALLLHTGVMQEKQGLETLVEAGALLRPDGAVLGLVGDGMARAGLQALAERLDAGNVHFLPLQDDYPATLAAADVLLLCQRAAVVDAVAPSKLLSYMAAGKPVVAAVDAASEAARLVERAGAGVVVPPEQPERVAEPVRALLADPAHAARLGEAGRRHVIEHYDERAALDAWEAMLTSVAAGGR